MRSIRILFLLLASSALAQPAAQLSPDLRGRIDRVVLDGLASTGAPSASIAIVKDGQIVYLHAYGNARLDPPTPAQSSMRYSLGSISKQFTATAILMLAEQGKLSLDEPVARFLPDITRARDITIRQLLSHTSGYQDYWPQDYVPPFMLEPVTASGIIDRWARKPLDFDPGTQWQYSNTGFVILGVIVEKASGMPLLDFLSRNIFAPLGMKSVLNVDEDRLTETDAVGYLRYAGGPAHPAPKEGKGWLFAAGELAMPAEDLARWDIGMINRSLLKPASYAAMQTEVLLRNGQGARYALGLSIRTEANHHALEHGGGVSGFSTHNIVFPEDRAAVVVLTNLDASPAPQRIATRIAPLLFETQDAHSAQALVHARQVFEGLQQGKIDRSLLTANAASYFTATALHDFAAGLAPLGAMSDLRETFRQERGGMTFRELVATFPQRKVEIWYREMPDGLIEQFQVAGIE